MEKDNFKDALFDFIPLPSWIYDFQTLEILDVNSTAFKHYGYSREEFLQLTLKDLGPAQEVSKLLNTHLEIKNKEGNIYFGIFTHQKRNGTLIQMEINGHKADFNDRQCILVVCQDVTKKIELEKKILQSEQRFKALVQDSADMISILDANGKYRYTSPMTKIILGIAPEEFEGMTIFDFMHPDDIESASGYMQRISTERKLRVEPFRLRNGKNEWRWIETVLTNMMDNPAVNGIVANSKDITAQKNKELENELLGTVSLNLRIDNDFPAAAKRVCQTISQFGKFDFVELWLPNIENNQLRLIAANATTSKAENFYEWSKDIKSFLLDEGLPGIVWQKKSTVLWRDIHKKNDFVRQEAAVKAGIVSALGIPIFFNQKVVGVLIIGTDQAMNYLKQYIKLFEKVEGLIGSEINRKKLENDLQHFYDAIPDLVCIGDFEGKFLKINKAGCSLLGYTEDEILHQPFDRFVHPEDKAGIANDFKRLLTEGKTAFESRYITKSGATVWLSWTCNSSLTERLVYATAKNITHEKKLQELNKQAGSLAKIGSWEVDLINSTAYWSDITHELHETDLKSYTPNLEDGINFYREDFREMVRLRLENSIKSGVGWDFEAVIVTSNDNELWIRSIGNAEFIEGKCVRLYGSFQDIHEINTATIELEKSNKILSDYKFSLDQSAIIAFTDNKGVITSTNDNFCKISGYSKEELLGQTHQIVNSKHHPKEFFVDLWKTISSGKVFRGEIKNKTKDGSYYWVDTTIVPFLDDKSEPIQYLAIRFDITARKKAEEDKISLQTTIENSLNEVYVFDAQTLKFSYANRGALLNLGYTEGELKTLSPLDLKPQYSSTDFKKLINPLLNEEKEKIIFYTNHKRKDGSLYPVEVHLQLVKEDYNKRFIAIILDITERKKAEAEIRDSEEKRRLIMSGALDAIICINIDETITFWNPQAEVIFGWKESEVLGLKLSGLIIPERYRRFHVEGLKNYLKTGEGKALNVLLELSAIRRNSKEFPIELTVIPITQGVEVFFCAFIRDITERKKSEKSILEANERFEKVTDATNDAIWDFDVLNNHLFWGKGFYTLFGYRMDDINPSFDLLVSFIHEDDRERISSKISQYMGDAKRINWYEEYRFLRADGSFAFVIDRAIFLRNNQGEVIRVIGAMTDITQQKNHETQLVTLNESLRIYARDLERSNEELESFAFVTSHDLQEPLRMISSFMDQLKRKYGDQLDEKALQYIHFATDGAKRMKQIILDLLEYSRAGMPTESIEKVDVNEIISGFKQLRRKIILEKAVTITTLELPTIYSYKAAVTQIFHSLLDNAIKYSKKEIAPRIEIAALENDDEWQFEVKDQGIGIKSEFYNQIFIIFQRLHNKSEYDGSGIGLSIAKKHVEFLGGKIWLESIPDEGTTFYFTLAKQKTKNKKYEVKTSTNPLS